MNIQKYKSLCVFKKNLASYFRVGFCHDVLHFSSFGFRASNTYANRIFNMTTQERPFMAH